MEKVSAIFLEVDCLLQINRNSKKNNSFGRIQGEKEFLGD